MSLTDDVRAYLEGKHKKDDASPFTTTGIAAQYDEVESWIRARHAELLDKGDSVEVRMQKYAQAHDEAMERFFPKEPEAEPQEEPASKPQDEIMAEMLESMGRALGSIRHPEMARLVRMLYDEGIPCKFTGSQLVYYGHAGPPKPEPGHIYGPGWGSVLSVIANGYGRDEGLLEAMGLIWDADGWLHADEIFAAIKQHWDREES